MFKLIYYNILKQYYNILKHFKRIYKLYFQNTRIFK